MHAEYNKRTLMLILHDHLLYYQFLYLHTVQAS